MVKNEGLTSESYAVTENSTAEMGRLTWTVMIYGEKN